MMDFVHTLWNYNYWAHRKLWDCIQTITDDDFVKPVPYSIGSVHSQVVHVMWAEEVWYERVHGGIRPTFTAQDYPTRASIRHKWDQIEANWRVYLGNLTETELNRQIDVTPITGASYSLSVLEMLLHAVNHGTNHRAQILQIIHGYGGETFEQDLSFYYRHRQSLDK